jgi:chemotaxis signal transduction protein
MQALRFRIGDRALAMDLRWVREVCQPVTMRALPQSPAWLLGLFDFHGNLLPAVDGGSLLGGAPVQARLGSRLLLLHGSVDGSGTGACATFGLLVDSVEGVGAIDRGNAWSVREGLPGLPFVAEAVHGQGEPVLLLDAARLAVEHAGLLQGSGAALASNRAEA